MSDKMEQRFNVKFCFLLGKTALETLQMLKEVYKEEALGRTQVFEWFSRFKRGQMSVEDQPRPGRPSTSHTDDNVERIRQAIREDRRRTINEIAELTDVSWSACQRILTQDLNMKRVAAKFVPRLLSADQKFNRLTDCDDLKQQLQEDPLFLTKIITGDETWCYSYDPESKQQSSQWKTPSSPRPKKARQVRSNVKTMLIFFFDIKGEVHLEFVPPGQTVNQHFYLEVLKRLRNSVRNKRPELWKSNDWFLHHDNAPAHTAMSVKNFLAKNGMAIVSHPPYSPDLAPCDFFLFPTMKSKLKGKRFANVEEVKQKTKDALKTITRESYQNCFENWRQRWDKCIVVDGDYFEGD